MHKICKGRKKNTFTQTHNIHEQTDKQAEKHDPTHTEASINTPGKRKTDKKKNR